MILVVMGVSGCGKTLIGSKLAKKLGVPFHDADDFHPEANISKMKSGRPLNDDDRYPWLELLAANMRTWNSQGGAVLACSALKEAYRQKLRECAVEDLYFVHLKGTKELIADRIRKRQHQYMPARLLDSQFADLEEPVDAISVSIERSPDEIVAEVLKAISP